MKKFIALVLSLTTLFLCSCSQNSENSEETTVSATSTTAAEETTKAVVATNNDTEYVTEWNYDLLPEDFPPPPSNTHNVEYEHGTANEEYSSDWIRIQFSCPENEIYRFTNEFIKAGYTGGAKKIASPSSYYQPGFNGYWQNGKNYIRIAASQYSNNGEITVLVDIAECRDNFPQVLTSIFPKFNGFTKNQGLYNEYDENRNRTGNEFIGSLNAESWSWDFGFENAFVGVSENEVDAYVDELINAEFSGLSATNITDGCTVVTYDLIKETGDTTYGVFIAYNQILKTMDIVYTNDISLYVNI